MSLKILTKSRYTKGLQCEKLLWLTVHEPDATELTPDAAAQARFDAGNRVGHAARAHIGGGTLIDRAGGDFLAPIRATRAAIDQGATVLYEATFLEDDIYCAVDILVRDGDGWTLIEVKSSTKVKAEHLPDIAAQVYVARRAGLDARRTEVMVLNRECRYPDLSTLFVRHDVTADIEDHLRAVAGNAKRFLNAIRLPEEPQVVTGAHCATPRSCPFTDRCYGETPRQHVSSLYYTTPATTAKLVAQGYNLVNELDEQADIKLSVIQQRQVRAVRASTAIVEAGLERRLAQLQGPFAFLDFETVSPAIPIWEGCRPYDAVPVQFSCHVERNDQIDHHEWIATKPGDPRREIALALIAACRDAATILTYNASFETARIRELAQHLPDLAPALSEIVERIADLLPIVRENVYHPEFHGSFSIKAVLPALCPELSYDDLNVRDGGTATQILETLLTEPDRLGDSVAQHIDDLRAYCWLDTWAMVKLLERLRQLAVRRIG